MRKGHLRKLVLLAATVAVFTPAIVRETFAKTESQVESQIIRRVRQELVTLPYYGVFDWLAFEVHPDGTVVLKGEVVRPTTKSDAENRVKNTPGVTKVVNEIEVLPLSPSDDRLRVALYRTLYNWDSPLFRYATQSIPPIHIIVKNGRATLKGVVASKADAELAYIRARGVPGLFDVKSELTVEGESPR